MTQAPTIADGTLTLPRTLTLAEATPLASVLKENAGAPLSVDASSVDHLGAQCLQVLLAAAQSWRAAGHPLTLTHSSAAFTEGLTRLGVSQDALTA